MKHILLLVACAGSPLAAQAWSTAHVAPAGSGHPQLCFAGADRVLGLAQREPSPVLETWERDSGGWFERRTAHAPSARSAYALGHDPGRRVVILFGGLDSTSALGDTWEWDGIDWILRTPSISPSPRYGAAAAFDTARGRFVVYGGTFLGDQWEWDGTAWAPIQLAGPTPGTRSAPMIYDTARGVLVLFGGSDGQSAFPLQDTWEYGGTTWVQRSTASAPPRLTGAAMTYDSHTGHSVLYGGRDMSTFPSVANTDVWDWDGTQWHQHVSAVNPGERRPAGFVYDAAAHRCVLHGSFEATDTWELDPATFTWTRANYSAVRSPVTLAANDFTGHTLLCSLSETLRWDHTSRIWQDVTPPVRPVSATAMAFDFARREAVLLTSASATWIWDDIQATWQQRMPAHSPPPTLFGAMAYDPIRARTVLYGGSTSLGVSGEVWEWDGIDWTNATPTGGPAPRLGAAMAFDIPRGTTVMFGGATSATAPSYQNDVWDWDGTTWTQRPMAGNVPTPRYSAALVADGQRVLMYGGQTQPTLTFGMSDELWELSGTNWVLLGNGPLACRSPTAALDRTSGEFVLFGGVVNAGTVSHAVPGVWIYGDPRAGVTPYGAGCSGAAGPATIDASGVPRAGNAAFSLQLACNTPSQPSAFAFGLIPRRLDLFADCSLLVDAPAIAVVPGAPSGPTSLPLPIPAGTAFLGLRIVAQGGVLDAATGTISLSGGLELRIGR